MEVDEKPTEDYSDIGGLDKQIRELVEAIVLPMTHKKHFENLGIRPPKGVLLYGPPGTGKTTTVVEIVLQEAVRRRQRVLVCAASKASCSLRIASQPPSQTRSRSLAKFSIVRVLVSDALNAAKSTAALCATARTACVFPSVASAVVVRGPNRQALHVLRVSVDDTRGDDAEGAGGARGAGHRRRRRHHDGVRL